MQSLSAMRLHRQKAIDVGKGDCEKGGKAVSTANPDTFATANTSDALNVEHFDSINESLLFGNILHLAGNSTLSSYLENEQRFVILWYLDRSFMWHHRHYCIICFIYLLFITSFPFGISRDSWMLELRNISFHTLRFVFLDHANCSLFVYFSAFLFFVSLVYITLTFVHATISYFTNILIFT